MIKIKDNIFNENDIKSIEEDDGYLIVDLKYEDQYLYIEGTIEDIVFNCEYKQDYKTRNEKAIEYIEEHKQLSMFADLRKENTHQYDLECDANDLLNILKGEE